MCVSVCMRVCELYNQYICQSESVFAEGHQSQLTFPLNVQKAAILGHVILRDGLMSCQKAPVCMCVSFLCVWVQGVWRGGHVEI